MTLDLFAGPRAIRDMPAEDYHAMKALSASGAWTLAEECAAKFLWESPWNPNREPVDTLAFDLGKAAHLAVLEPARFEAATAVIDAPNYKGGKAQDARDTARAEGRVPLLPHQLDVVMAMAGAIRAHPIAGEAFAGGEPEVTLTWADEACGIPCKARVDWQPRHGRWMVDLKTAASANPRHWRDQAFRLGYHARAAWYLDAGEAVFGRRPENYWFVIVEKEPPYLVSVAGFDEAAIEWGRMSNRRAIDLFAAAAGRNDWPGYREPGANRDRAFRVSLPPWAIYQLHDRSEAGEFSNKPIDPKLLRAAERFLSPNPSEATR